MGAAGERVMNATLADTLIALLGHVDVPPAMGLWVTELAVQMPLEVRAAVVDGRLELLAQAPHSRWDAGFLPPVQRMSARLVLEE
jgi:hypothetical protein